MSIKIRIVATTRWYYLGGCRALKLARPSRVPTRAAVADAFLNETLFTSLMLSRLALEEWRRDYNTVRPHSRIGWLAPPVYSVKFCRNGTKAGS